MKSIALASLLLLLFACVALTPLTFADNNGPSANGSFQFALEDGDAEQSFSNSTPASKTTARLSAR